MKPIEKLDGWALDSLLSDNINHEYDLRLTPFNITQLWLKQGEIINRLNALSQKLESTASEPQAVEAQKEVETND